MAQTFSVSDATELLAAINSAQGGDRIELASGNYGELLLQSKRFDGEGITITSADPGAPAVFEKIGLYRSENMHFDAIEVDYEPTGDTGYSYAFYAHESNDISLRNSTLEGGYNEDHENPEAAIRPAGFGIQLRQNENITIENNEISVFHIGIQFTYVDGLNVIDNYIHDLRISPLTGGGTTNAQVIGNHFSTSDPLNFGGTGDHGNLIHFYPRPNLDGPMQNIIIRDNFLEQGAGTEALLGIHIDDTGGGATGTGYENVVIENNILHNGNAQGIRAENVDGLSIVGNTLLQSTGDSRDAPGILLVRETENTVIDGNIIAGSIDGTSVDAADAFNIQIGDNLKVQNREFGRDDYVGDLIVNGLTSDGDAADFLARPGSAAEGYGAQLSQGALSTGQMVGLINDARGERLDLRTITFDAEVRDATGEIDLSGADITWDFGDGTTGTGDGVSHAYDNAGRYDVTGTIRLADGEVVTVTKTVDVFTPNALLANFETGIADVSAIENDVLMVGDLRLEEGRFGQALRLGTTDAKVEFIRSDEIIENDAFSISLAFQKDGGSGTNSDTGQLIYFSGTAHMSVGDEGQLSFSGKTSTGQNIRLGTESAAIEDGGWHQVTYTFSSETGTAVLYLDGVEVDRQDDLTGIQHTTGGHDLHLGGRVSGGFGGLMDELSFTRVALTPKEVQARYEALFNEDVVPPVAEETEVEQTEEPPVEPVELPEPTSGSGLIAFPVPEQVSEPVSPSPQDVIVPEPASGTPDVLQAHSRSSEFDFRDAVDRLCDSDVTQIRIETSDNFFGWFA